MSSLTRAFPIVIVSLLACASTALGAFSASYGNLNGTTVVYQQIAEGTNTDNNALFGAPSINGDSLLFNPTLFGANATGANGLDITDGTLTASIQAVSNKWIQRIVFNEQGDYTLYGPTGTAATSVVVSSRLFVTVTHLDGNPLQIPETFDVSMTFSPSDGTYNLIEDPGFTKLWQGGLDFDLSAALGSRGYSQNATKATISLDNQLIAMSEAGTIAYIKKKEVDGVAITATAIPEPGCLGLLVLGGLLLLRRRG